MKKTNRKLCLFALCVALFSLFMFAGKTLSWYYTASKINLGSVTGGISYLANYFESGDGTAEHPYEIAKPEQLYNLAWLQYLGAFNNTKNDESFEPFHFYISNKYTGAGKTLDMTGFVLPPIGTQDYPFIGYLDGQGNTVANLTVANVTTDDVNEAAKIYDIPRNVTYLQGSNISGVEIIGFMGVVGPLTGNGTYSNSEKALKDIKLSNITVNTQTNKALIGLAAGYVNGPMSNVAVAGGSVVIKSGTNAVNAASYTENLSDYSVIGYAKEAYRDQIDVVNIEVAEKARGFTTFIKEDDGNTWGGSIDMYSLHTRLSHIFDAADTSPSYVTAETVTIDEVNGTTSTQTTATATVHSNAANNNNYEYYYYSSPRGGSFNFGYDSKTFGAENGVYYRYICLYGVSALYPKTVTTWLYDDQYFNAFYISKNGTYLTANLSAASGISAANAKSDAARWAFDDDGYLFTIIEGVKYYLGVSNNDGTVNATENRTYIWTKSADDTLKTTVNGMQSYLYLDGSTWRVKSSMRITDGSGHYLSVDGNGQITNTNEADATGWIVTGTADTPCVIYTYIGNTRYYLGFDNGNLVLTETLTQWYSDSGKRYCIVDDTWYYITYDNGWTTIQGTFSGYMISYNGTYLNANANNNGIVTTGTPTVWLTASSGNGYTFSYTVGNGTRYYLRHESNSLGIGTTNSNNAWNFSNGKLSYDVTSGIFFTTTTTYYLRYNGTWNISTTNSANTITLTIVYSSTTNALTFTDFGNPGGEDLALGYEAVTMQNVVKTVEIKPSGIPTYFPLKAADTAPFNVINENTGYVTSGARATIQHESGDIRVSWFPMSKISASLGGNSTYTGSRLQVLTRTTTSGGYVRISDSYNNGTASASTALRNYSYQTIEALGLTKYEEARDNLENVLAPNGTAAARIYGLHFMDATISKDYTVVAPEAVLNGDTYQNYELPQDSIDFTLKEKGKINFFAGSYYSTTVNSQTVKNNSFFSLYEIERDYGEEENPIHSIREIYKVYGDPSDDSKPYKYTYSENDTISDAGYELMFDLSWIKKQTLVDDAVYYFEIPANSGEYALGSVDDAYGAYLIYLDISANNQEIERNIYTETITTTTDTYEFPKGAAITNGSESVDATKGLTVKLTSAMSGTDAFSKTGSAVTYSYGTPTYIPDLTSANGVNGVGGIPIRTVQSIVERITFVDYNTTTKTTDTIVTTTTVTIDEHGQRSDPVVVRTINGVLTDDRTDYTAHEITSGTALARLQYLPGDATVSVTYGFTPANTGGSYAVTVTSTAQISVYATLINTDYTMNVNNTPVTTNKTTITVTP